MKHSRSFRWALLLALFLSASPAYAASLGGTLQNLVNAFVGRILSILALGYLGKDVFSHIQGDPNAKNESSRIVVATALLIGINVSLDARTGACTPPLWSSLCDA